MGHTRRFAALGLSLIWGTVLIAAQPTPVVIGAGQAWTYTFDGTPAQPQSFLPMDWEITRHSRDSQTWDEMEPMYADHGMDCLPEPSTHLISNWDDTLFTCKNHLMTALRATDYGMVYATPPQLWDLTSGEGTLSFALSTLRTSRRDWVDVWITPYDEVLSLPLDDWLPDGEGKPRNGWHIRMNQSGNQEGTVYQLWEIVNGRERFVPDTNGHYGYEAWLRPSAVRRDVLALTIAGGKANLCMPAYGKCFIENQPITRTWNQAVVQFGHHSYNPLKEDGVHVDTPRAGTWHWDDFLIAPAVPFTIQRIAQRRANADMPRVDLSQPAPANAILRVSGFGYDLEFSPDNGRSWRRMERRQGNMPTADDHFLSYWTPVPVGTTQILFRGRDYSNYPWHVMNMSIWTRDTGVSQPTRMPTAPIVTQTPVPTASPVPATQTSRPSQTVTASPVPATQTVTVSQTRIPTASAVPPSATLVPVSTPTRTRIALPTLQASLTPTERATRIATQPPTTSPTMRIATRTRVPTRTVRPTRTRTPRLTPTRVPRTVRPTRTRVPPRMPSVSGELPRTTTDL